MDLNVVVLAGRHVGLERRCDVGLGQPALVGDLLGGAGEPAAVIVVVRAGHQGQAGRQHEQQDQSAFHACPPRKLY